MRRVRCSAVSIAVAQVGDDTVTMLLTAVVGPFTVVVVADELTDVDRALEAELVTGTRERFRLKHGNKGAG